MTLQHRYFIMPENYSLHSLCNWHEFSISVWYEMKKTLSSGPFELGEIWDTLLSPVLMPSMTGWFELTVRIHHFTERLKRSSYCFEKPGDWVLLSAEVISQTPWAHNASENTAITKNRPYIHNPFFPNWMSPSRIFVSSAHSCTSTRKLTNHVFLFK